MNIEPLNTGCAACHARFLAVACPRCGAKKDEPCRSMGGPAHAATGKPVHHVHQARRRLVWGLSGFGR